MPPDPRIGVFALLDSRELAEAIDRLSRLVDKLARDGVTQGEHYRVALQEAQAEQTRRQAAQG